MRQAGRYMPEYRGIRAKHSILEICKRPELAAEVTLQPIEALGVDAAIIFADLLLPLEPMGLNLEFVEGDGPTIHNPVRRGLAERMAEARAHRIDEHDVRDVQEGARVRQESVGRGVEFDHRPPAAQETDLHLPLENVWTGKGARWTEEVFMRIAHPRKYLPTVRRPT